MSARRFLMLSCVNRPPRRAATVAYITGKPFLFLQPLDDSGLSWPLQPVAAQAPNIG